MRRRTVTDVWLPLPRHIRPYLALCCAITYKVRDLFCVVGVYQFCDVCTLSGSLLRVRLDLFGNNRLWWSSRGNSRGDWPIVSAT